MFDEFSKSIKASLYDRTSSPLFGSFVIAWCFWNYKAVLILISTMSVQGKFLYIEGVLFPDFESVIYGFFWPLVAALLFIYVYPIPAQKVYEYSRKKQKELKK